MEKQVEQSTPSPENTPEPVEIEIEIEGFETKPEPEPVPVPDSTPEPQRSPDSTPSEPVPVPEIPEPRDDTPWPEEAKKNREAWLAEAARRTARHADSLTHVLFSTGYGKGGTRGHRQVYIIANKSGVGFQVFIRPTVHSKDLAAGCVRAALSGLNIRARFGLDDIGNWPDYPQPEASEVHTPQATRMIKAKCPVCGCTLRISDHWIEKSEGKLTCPMPGCGTRMEITR